MNQDDGRDSIGELASHLYSRKNKNEYKDSRSEITHGEFEVNSSWSNSDTDITDLLHRERDSKQEKQKVFFKKILIGSVIFFFVAIGISVFMFFGGSNFISGNNIDVAVVGQNTTAGGEELSLDIVVKNNNRANIEGVNILVEYPSGSRVAGDLNTELTRQREFIGNISAHGEARKTFKSVLFGEKETIQEIKITLEYRVQGSSAVFFKDKKYEIAIKSSPVIVTISNPNEVNSNQSIEFTVDLASNSAELLKNVLFQVEYPFGFSFEKADPPPTLDNNIWSIGDLPSTGKRTIRIKGILQGQNEEERTFRFSTGIADQKQDMKLGAIFSLLQETIRIKRPFVGVDVTLSGDNSSEYVAVPGERVQANIVWQNNLPNQLLDTKVEVRFNGQALDKSTVSTSGDGFYRSIDNVIVWDKNTDNTLRSLEPGESGAVGFSFSPLASFSSGSVSQDIDVSVTVSGSQVGESGKPELVSTTINKTVKLASSANMSARVVRSIGAFENSGPIPPRADMPTTYTVVWTATNSLNTLSQTRVTAKLPPYVTWQNLSHPDLEKVSFDTQTNEVVWNIGDLRAGTGGSLSPRQVAFQVSLLPSLTQVGSAPVLVYEARLVGTDRFTGKNIQVTSSAVTTRFTTDPAFVNGDEMVAK